MPNPELVKIKDRVQELQNIIDRAYIDHPDYKFDIVKESTSYLRFLLTSLRLKLYDELTATNPGLINLFNIYILHYVPDSDNDKDFGMRFYLNIDQVDRINEISQDVGKAFKFRTEMFANNQKAGLAKLSMFLAKRGNNINNIDIQIWDNWQKHKIYTDPHSIKFDFEPYDNATLLEELKIYGIKEDDDSTMVVGTMPEGIEVFLLFNKIISPEIAAKSTYLLRVAFQKFLGEISKKWTLLAFDQILWEYIYKNKLNNGIIPLWDSIQNGLQNNNYFDYMKSCNNDDILLNFTYEYLDLWNFCFTKDDFKTFSETLRYDDSAIEHIRKNINLANQQPIALALSKRNNDVYRTFTNSAFYNKRKSLWVKTQQFKDLGAKFMASHDGDHVNNLCCLAFDFIENYREFKDILPDFFHSIYLHDVGMGEYFREVEERNSQNQTTDTLNATRRVHSLSSANQIKKDNKRIWDLNENELEHVIILTAYHVKKAPMVTGDQTTLKYDENFIMIENLFDSTPENKVMLPLEVIKRNAQLQNDYFPYFLFVSLLRLIDSMDIHDIRASKYGLKKFKDIMDNIQVSYVSEQPLHIFKHAAMANHKLDINKNYNFNFKINYGPEFFMPLVVVMHGYASAIDEISSEKEKINRKEVIDQINSELQAVLNNTIVSIDCITVEYDLFGFFDCCCDNWNKLYAHVV